MTVKAVYEDGVLKPKGPLPFKEHEEVEIDVRPAPEPAAADDPKSFVGFIKNAPEGVPLAREHDLYIDHEQYEHMTYYLRPLMAQPEWAALAEEEQIRRFVEACKHERPDLMELWEGMDRLAFMWHDALHHCTGVIQREGAAATRA